MIEKRKVPQRSWDKDRIMAEIKEYKEQPNADDVLSHMLGTMDYIGDSRYTAYRYDENKRTLLNRINMLWIMPIFIVTMPFQWIVFGQCGLSRNSRIGRIADKLVKF